MADLLTFQYPSGTKEFVPIAKGTAAQHNSIYRGEELPYTWAELKTKIQSGDFSNLYIGDYKTITLTTNETVVMEIAGINNYADWGRSTQIGRHIDFISRNCLATKYQFNTTNINNGTSTNEYPWLASALVSSLNDGTTGVKSTLPSDVQDVIIGKHAYTEKRYSSGGTVSSDTGAAWTSLLKLWVPSEVEVFGHATWSEIGHGTAGFQQYPIFRLNPNKIIKCAGNGGVRTPWWTLSARRENSTQVCIADTTGYSTRTDATITYGVPLCFRIG